MKTSYLILIGIVVIAAAAAGIYVFTQQPGVKEFRLEAREYGFDSAKGGPTLRVRVGDTVRIILTNGGVIEHELMIVEDVDEGIRMVQAGQHPHLVFADAEGHVEPGETITITFTVDKPGHFFYACFVEEPENHAVLGMFGDFIVEGDEARWIGKA